MSDAAAHRRRDLLLTAVMLGILLTPAWLMPTGWSQAWQLAVLALGLPALWLSWTHAPFHPTPQAELARLLPHFDLDPSQAFCDLGAGDGRLLRWVHEHTGARCHGVEASPLPYLLARLRLRGSPVTLAFGDLMAADLSRFDVVYVWGTAYAVGTEAFARRMTATLRPGARLVSYHHRVPGLPLLAEDHDGQRPIYVHEMPEACAAPRPAGLPSAP